MNSEIIELIVSIIVPICTVGFGGIVGYLVKYIKFFKELPAREDKQDERIGKLETDVSAIEKKIGGK
jgi:hypothetical protein